MVSPVIEELCSSSRYTMNTGSVVEEHRSLTNAPNKLNLDTLVRQLLPVLLNILGAPEVRSH